MADALYGEAGYYTRAGAPGRGFRTAAHAGHQWAAAIQELARRVDAALGEPAGFAVVDVGAGGGELLAAMATGAPHRWQLCGVDIASRPAGLPDRVVWTQQWPEHVTGLLLANELLDVVPVDVVERSEGWARYVEVTTDGEEELGALVTGRDAEWLSRWWPLGADGDRAEIGWPRDDAWQSLCGTLDRGVAVAVDYAVDPGRDAAGTLAGFRTGRQVDPVPDGSCDLTAHVLIESLVSPADVVISQRDALRQLGIAATPPAQVGEPAAYLAALSDAGAAAELIDPAGLGGFTWLLHSRGVGPPVTPGGGGAISS